ncbi:MAG: hypothetical protein U9M95_01610 [Candidatus Altiarchaeota archaeon]|nr:hypothetical protein [Candidatus Altiarchaeota archaeon]
MEKSLYEKKIKQVAKKTELLHRKINLEWDTELEEAIEFNRMQVSPREVTAAAWITGAAMVILSTIISITAHIYLGTNPLILLLIGSILSLLALYYVSEYPKITASTRRIKALGRAPEIIAYLIIPLKQNPNLEEAVKFAAENSRGELALDLKKTLWDVWSGKNNSLGGSLPLLGYRWSKNVKGFQDALYAIRTSQIEKTEYRRLNTLDRAMDSVLKGIQESFKEFIEYLRLPTLVMFAGGAILPLVVVIMIPLVSFMGSELGNPVNLSLLLLTILAFMYLYSEYTLRKRPASFPVMEISDTHPLLPPAGKLVVLGRNMSVKKTTLWVTLLISSLSIPYLLGLRGWPVYDLTTLPLLAGLCLGFCIYLGGKSLYKKKIRDSIRETEKEVLEATFQLGNRLLSGMSAEDAMIKVARMLPKNPSGASAIYWKAVQNIRYLNTDMEGAFFNEKIGALRETYSSMINTLSRLMVTSMKKSINSASESLITAANHIKEIQKMESNLKNKISYTSSMMKITAVFISPAICALTVYIARVFQKTSAITSSIQDSSFTTFLLREQPTSPEILQLIVGLYMLALLYILVRYNTILEHGDDSVIVQYEISRSLPIALTIFVGVIAVSNIFL